MQGIDFVPHSAGDQTGHRHWEVASPSMAQGMSWAYAGDGEANLVWWSGTARSNDCLNQLALNVMVGDQGLSLPPVFQRVTSVFFTSDALVPWLFGLSVLREHQAPTMRIGGVAAVIRLIRRQRVGFFMREPHNGCRQAP